MAASTSVFCLEQYFSNIFFYFSYFSRFLTYLCFDFLFMPRNRWKIYMILIKKTTLQNALIHGKLKNGFHFLICEYNEYLGETGHPIDKTTIVNNILALFLHMFLSFQPIPNTTNLKSYFILFVVWNSWKLKYCSKNIDIDGTATTIYSNKHSESNLTANE